MPYFNKYITKRRSVSKQKYITGQASRDQIRRGDGEFLYSETIDGKTCEVYRLADGAVVRTAFKELLTEKSKALANFPKKGEREKNKAEIDAAMKIVEERRKKIREMFEKENKDK